MSDIISIDDQFMFGSGGDFEIFRANHFEVYWSAIKGFQSSVQMFKVLESNRFKLRVLDLVSKRDDLWKQFNVHQQGDHIKRSMALFQFDTDKNPLAGVVFENVKLVEPPLPFLYYENSNVSNIDLIFEYDAINVIPPIVPVKTVYECWQEADKEPGELD